MYNESRNAWALTIFVVFTLPSLPLGFLYLAAGGGLSLIGLNILSMIIVGVLYKEEY